MQLFAQKSCFKPLRIHFSEIIMKLKQTLNFKTETIEGVLKK